jgi:hypothetical protein
MNHRKHKQADNRRIIRNKEVMMPCGYVNDPPGTKCPYCGEENKVCSYINSMARAYGRSACAKKHNDIKWENQ